MNSPERRKKRGSGGQEGEKLVKIRAFHSGWQRWKPSSQSLGKTIALCIIICTTIRPGSIDVTLDSLQRRRNVAVVELPLDAIEGGPSTSTKVKCVFHLASKRSFARSARIFPPLCAPTRTHTQAAASQQVRKNSSNL